MFWFLDSFERDIRSGKLSYESYTRLIGAEAYGQASSMGALRKDLFRMLGNIQKGRNYVIDRGPRGKLTVGSRLKFIEWVQNDFPDAYACFFSQG